MHVVRRTWIPRLFWLRRERIRYLELPGMFREREDFIKHDLPDLRRKRKDGPGRGLSELHQWESQEVPAMPCLQREG